MNLLYFNNFKYLIEIILIEEKVLLKVSWDNKDIKYCRFQYFEKLNCSCKCSLNISKLIKNIFQV